MESVGQPRFLGACSLLGVPVLSTPDLDVDDEDGEVVIGIRPKCSPLPRRRSSVSDEDWEPEPPLSGSRRVSFADAKGLSLVQVKEFDCWDVPKLPGYDSTESEGKDAEEYFLSPLSFSLPLSTEELLIKVREQKMDLESIRLLPGTTILKGMIRVLNISFDKTVYIRTTLDSWSTHFDLLAEYIPGSSDSLTDCFSFKLTLVPPFGEQGARVDFCLRYETPVGTFWANNNNKNYVLFCHQRVKERKEKTQLENANRKSCLKAVSQNFSTVENISATEASSQENMSTDVSKHGEKVDMKDKLISDGQSGKSEEDRQKLLAENRRNCSRRNRRRAARLARVRDLFAQQGGGANGTERDESPPEANRATQEETVKEKQSDMQSFSELISKSEGSPLVSESCSEPICDVPSDTSPAHDFTSNSEPGKSESINVADSATLTGGESVTDIPDNSLHSNDDPAAAEHQRINKSVSKAEESSQKQGMSHNCTSDIAAEPADSVISEPSTESLVSESNSFTFGTVVAPLYHQVSGKVRSESQSVGDWGNPVQSVGDLTHTERRDTSCTVQTGAHRVQAHVVKTEESKQESLDATLKNPPAEEDEQSLSMTANDTLNNAETPKRHPGGTVIHPYTVNALNAELSNPQKPTESLHLQGEAQEDNLTHDLRSQTAAETAQAQLVEHACTQTQTNPDDSCAQSETEDVMTSPETSFIPLNSCECVDESNKDITNDVCSTITEPTNNGMSEEDKLLEALHELSSNHINNSCTKETENSCVSCFEILEETDVTPQMSLENHKETNDVEGENEEEMKSNYHTRVDTSVQLKDEDTLKDEEMIVSEETEAAVLKQGDVCLADPAEVKNWEMMVEEEEKNILTDEEESVEISSKAEDAEKVDKDRGQQQDDTGNETALENRDITETDNEIKEAMVMKITGARAKENEAEDADASGDKHWIGKEQTVEIVTVKDDEAFEKELKYVRTEQEEELAEETEVDKREEQDYAELENEELFAEMEEVSAESINIQGEEEKEGEGEVDVDLNDDGVEREDHVQPREENPDYNEDILAHETSKIEDAELESITKGDSEKRLDEIKHEDDNGLSALDSVQDRRINDKGNTGEAGGQNAQIPTEVDLYKEGAFQSNENVTQDLFKSMRGESESAAAEGGSSFLADEPESDQFGHNSASESDSDDEVELYMHCLRAVHTGAQAQKDRNKETSFSGGRRPSVSRNKLLSSPMPSISESLDEEPNLSCLQDNDEDMETADFQPTAADLLQPSQEQERINRNVSWWKETFSCSNVSKTLLRTTLLVVFAVVAFHYDFLACFGLYLISVIWLCCQGERQPAKNNSRIG